MSELLLDTSERRTARVAAVPQGQRSLLRPLLISVACAAALSGFAVAASSVMAGLVTPAPRLSRAPAIDKGLAASWPDLKDGLPSRAGEPVKVTESKPETPNPESGPRIAAFSADPKAFDASTPTLPMAQAKPKPVAERPAPVKPTERIPVPTEVTVLDTLPAARIVTPSRTIATLAPRPSETVRARDEAVAVAEEPAKVATPKPVAAATPVPAKPKPAPVATAKPAPPPAKVAAAETPKPAAKPVAARHAATQTASAEPEPEETEILGVKLPSLAPAGQKLTDGVSDLGDAVRNAF